MANNYLLSLERSILNRTWHEARKARRLELVQSMIGNHCIVHYFWREHRSRPREYGTVTGKVLGLVTPEQRKTTQFVLIRDDEEEHRLVPFSHLLKIYPSYLKTLEEEEAQ